MIGLEARPKSRAGNTLEGAAKQAFRSRYGGFAASDLRSEAFSAALLDPLRTRRPARALILLALLVLLAASACGRRPAVSEDASGEPAPAPVAVQVVRAQVRSVARTVRAQGTLTPADSYSAQVAPVVVGRLHDILVRDGDLVTRGQVLAHLDNRADRNQAEAAAAALASAQVDRQKSAGDARAALAAETLAREKLRRGARPQELAQIDQAVARERATRDRAQTECERVSFLYEKGTAARRQVDDARTALQVAEASLKSAQAQASMLHAGARREDLQAAEWRERAAREALIQTQRLGDARVQQARAALEAANAVSGYGELRAPLDGRVFHRSANPGDVVGPSAPLLQIVDPGHLVLVASIAVEEAGGVRAGQAAIVRTAPTAPPLAGRVRSVGQADPQTGLLEVRIAVDPQGQAAPRIGSFATAEIVVKRDLQAVTLPKETVLRRNGRAVVFTVDAQGAARETAVTPGFETDGSVEILQGVAAGAQVVRVGQYELSDGAKVVVGGPRKSGEESADKPAQKPEQRPVEQPGERSAASPAASPSPGTTP